MRANVRCASPSCRYQPHRHRHAEDAPMKVSPMSACVCRDGLCHGGSLKRFIAVAASAPPAFGCGTTVTSSGYLSASLSTAARDSGAHSTAPQGRAPFRRIRPRPGWPPPLPGCQPPDPLAHHLMVLPHNHDVARPKPGHRQQPFQRCCAAPLCPRGSFVAPPDTAFRWVPTCRLPCLWMQVHSRANPAGHSNML